MRIPVITGPTAVGKSSLAVSVAERLGGDVVSCDSRQIYAELTAGTAKPSAEELNRVSHHLIGTETIAHPVSAGGFARRAERVITSILEGGRVPILVGGSTLYLRALIDGLADIPDVDENVRLQLNERLAAAGPQPLYDELLEVDPVFAASLDATKSQRIIRGLEVFRSSGRPLSSYHAEQKPPRFQYKVVVMDRDRAELHERINARVHELFRGGLPDEVAQLSLAGFDPQANPLRTIGYSEVGQLLSGLLDRDQAISLIQRNTRRYAKRQLTWFRSMEGARWIRLSDHADAVSEVCEHFLSEDHSDEATG